MSAHRSPNPVAFLAARFCRLSCSRMSPTPATVMPLAGSKLGLKVIIGGCLPARPDFDRSCLALPGGRCAICKPGRPGQALVTVALPAPAWAAVFLTSGASAFAFDPDALAQLPTRRQPSATAIARAVRRPPTASPATSPTFEPAVM